MNFPTDRQLQIFKRTPGAISVHEMLGIMSVVSQCPVGVFAEMGSHRGKSGVATACAMIGNQLHLVDPLYDMENLEAWKHACQGHPDNAWQGSKEPDFHESVKAPIREASFSLVSAILHGDFSTHAIPALYDEHGAFSYVLLDTDQHTYELTRDELALLRHRMKIGGCIGFHDFQSQFLGVEQAYREMLQGGMYEEVSIPWDEIKLWVSQNGGEAGCDSWHHTEMEAPCFYGGLRRVK